jgi:hypothetical protein
MATIRVLRELPFPSFLAWADSGTFRERSERSWDVAPGGGTHEWFRNVTERTGHSQYVAFDGYIYHPIAYPAQPLTDVTLSQSTGGRTVHAATYPVLAAEDTSITSVESRWCVERASGEGVVATLVVCTFARTYLGEPSWYTYLRYYWNAGEVTYHSEENHSLLCQSSRCRQMGYPFYSSWGWNTTDHTLTGQLVSFGPDYTIAVSMVSGGERYSTTANMPLVNSYFTYGTPYACTNWGLINWPPSIIGFGHVNECFGTVREYWSYRGSVDG